MDINDYPHVQAWRKKLLARPAVQKGGAAGKDWREDLKSISNEDFAKLFGIEKNTERQKNDTA